MSVCIGIVFITNLNDSFDNCKSCMNDLRWSEIKPSALLCCPLRSNFFSLCSCSCSVFLLDRLSHELVAKVFDGGVVSDEEV